MTGGPDKDPGPYDARDVPAAARTADFAPWGGGCVQTPPGRLPIQNPTPIRLRRPWRFAEIPLPPRSFGKLFQPRLVVGSCRSPGRYVKGVGCRVGRESVSLQDLLGKTEDDAADTAPHTAARRSKLSSTPNRHDITGTRAPSTTRSRRCSADEAGRGDLRCSVGLKGVHLSDPKAAPDRLNHGQ